MMKKTLLALVVGILLLFAFSVPCLAAQKVAVRLDGEATNIQGAVVNGRAMIPMRDIGEALGAFVVWDGSDKSVTIEKMIYKISASGQYSVSLKRIKMWLDKTELRVDGIIVDPLDVSPRIIDGKTMVPLRVVSNWLGAAVEWDPASQTVEISGGLNGSFSEAEFKKALLDGAEREAINNILREAGTITEEPAVWVSEYTLNEQAQITLIANIPDFAVGFYKSGIAATVEVLYAMDELPADFKSVDGINTYNGIRIKIENGVVYYNQEDLIKAGLLAEPVGTQYVAG